MMCRINTIYVYFSLHYHQLAGALVHAGGQHLDALFLLFEDLEHVSEILLRNTISPLFLAENVRLFLFLLLNLILPEFLVHVI